MRLKNKVALITGVATGMGREAVSTFTREGAKVIGLDIKDSGQESVERAVAQGGDAIFVECDVTDEEQVASAVKQGVQHYGKLDVLYNNAGIGPPTDDVVTDLSLDVFEWVMRVNVTGVFLCSKHAIPHIVDTEGGSVINVASIGGLSGGDPDVPITAYGTSKAAVLGLTKQLAAQFARKKVRVNAVCPGPIDTPILDPFLDDPGVKSRFSEEIPIGRMGVPADVVNLCLYLASDEASFVTGSWIVIDGGITTF